MQDMEDTMETTATTSAVAGGVVVTRQGMTLVAGRRMARPAGSVRAARARRVRPAPPASDLPDTSAAAVQLRQLRYFRDLLALGLESTIWPDRSARTLRSERLALGIDLPELDAVAIWSMRCGDGTLAIPFADFILARARESAAWFEPWDQDGTLRRGLGRLEQALAGIAPPGRPVAALPRLEEVHLAESTVAGLFGSDGALDRLVEACETTLIGAGHRAAPAAS